MKLLILSLSNSHEDPRPFRLAKYANKLGLEVLVLNCSENSKIENSKLRFIGLNQNPIGKKFKLVRIYKYLNYQVMKYLKLLTYLLLPKISGPIYCKTLVPKHYREYINKVISEYEEVVVMDLAILPFALQRKSQNSRILYEAREYYEGQKSMYFGWSQIYSKLIFSLEKKYIRKVDQVTTVSEGISNLLYCKHSLIVKPLVIYGVPEIQKEFMFPKNKNMELLFHGHVVRDRNIHAIIPALLKLKDFELIIRGIVDSNYLQEITRIAKSLDVIERIKIVPAVKYENLFEATSKSKYGLLPWENMHNQKKFAMPNKFFEYLVSNVPVCAVAGSELSNLVEKYGLGIVYNGESDDLANRIICTSEGEYSGIVNNIMEFNKKFDYLSQMSKYDEFLMV